MGSTAAPSRMRTVRRSAVRITVLVLLVVLAAVALLYFRQHDMIYHPRPYEAELATGQPAGVIELPYRTLAGSHTAFYVPSAAALSLPERVWIAFGGNGSLALEWLPFIERHANTAEAFLLVDYPGYGKNEGYAAIATNRAAADGALEALAKYLGVEAEAIESRLDVIGHSFGAAAALDFGTRHKVSRIILVAPFTSLREAGALVVGELLSHLLIENYDNRARLADLADEPDPPRVAIFHGTQDDIIPVQMGRDLAAAHLAFVEFFPIDGADHLSPLFHHGDQLLTWMARR